MMILAQINWPEVIVIVGIFLTVGGSYAFTQRHIQNGRHLEPNKDVVYKDLCDVKTTALAQHFADVALAASSAADSAARVATSISNKVDDLQKNVDDGFKRVENAIKNSKK